MKHPHALEVPISENKFAREENGSGNPEERNTYRSQIFYVLWQRADAIAGKREVHQAGKLKQPRRQFYKSCDDYGESKAIQNYVLAI